MSVVLDQTVQAGDPHRNDARTPKKRQKVKCLKNVLGTHKVDLGRQMLHPASAQVPSESCNGPWASTKRTGAHANVSSCVGDRYQKTKNQNLARNVPTGKAVLKPPLGWHSSERHIEEHTRQHQPHSDNVVARYVTMSKPNFAQ